MPASSLRRVKAVRLLGIALVIAGFAPVLAFAVGSLIPSAEASAMLGLFPDLPWLAGIDAFLNARVRWSPPSGLLYALPSLCVMLLGAVIAKAQRPALEADRARKADARRRAHLYGSYERIEPTLGSAD